MQWLDETPDEATKVSLIVALRDITDGKIFVESERARLTRLLADIKEANGDVVGAADVLQEVAVETYGALDKKEKAAFILEQVRLTLLKKDYVRALIQSRKINRKVSIYNC
jgi:26S proteasome regulatory subunit N5